MNGNHNLFAVSDQTFAEEVTQSSLPVLVDFTADWCPPCRALAPVYEKLSLVYAGRLRFAKMDCDENQAIPAQYGIQAMPTLVLFANGGVVGRVVGPHPARLQASIDRLLAQITLKV